MPKANLRTVDQRASRKPGRRARCLFTQRNVERLYRAGRNAGMPNPRVEVDFDGKLSLVPGELAPPKSGSELDQWKAKHAHSTQGA